MSHWDHLKMTDPTHPVTLWTTTNHHKDLLVWQTSLFAIETFRDKRESVCCC
jgi:hypothetical protein